MRRRRRLFIVTSILLSALAVVVVEVRSKVTHASLSYSLASTVNGDDGVAGSGYFGSCRPRRANSWRCELMTEDASDAGIIYMLSTKGSCWTGWLVRSQGMMSLPARPLSCVGITDQLRIGDHISDVIRGTFRQPGFY